MSLFYEIKEFRIVAETLTNVVKPFMYHLSVLYCIYYYFALMGQSIFGGSVFINNDTAIN